MSFLVNFWLGLGNPRHIATISQHLWAFPRQIRFWSILKKSWDWVRPPPSLGQNPNFYRKFVLHASLNQIFQIESKLIKSFIFSPLLIAPSHHSLDLLLQPPPNFHSTISFDLSDTWLSPSQGFSFSTTTFSLGSIRASSFARKTGLLNKRKNKN